MFEQLIEALKKVLADSFAFRLKAQYYHWNIEGPDFPQYHALLGDLYSSVDEGVDMIAEHIRTLNAYAPGSFGRYKELTTIEDENTLPTAIEMLVRLENDNRTVIQSYNEAHTFAEQFKKNGIVNFIEERIDFHEKQGWMLRSIIARK